MRKFLTDHMPDALPVLLALAALAGLLLSGGCVNRQLAESYGRFLETVGAEYIQYVDADPTLDDTDRSVRHINYEEAVKTVDKFKSTRWGW